MIRFFSDLIGGISQKRRAQIERRKAEIRQRYSSETIHHLADGNSYKLTVDGWVDVQSRLDPDTTSPVVNATTNPVDFHGFATINL